MSSNSQPVRLAIFASGTGSNARKIVEYFETNPQFQIGLIASNKLSAGVLDLCSEYGLPKLTFDKNLFFDSDIILRILKVEEIDFIILAGFLWRIPEYLIDAYTDKIINIHPALLPKYGGKGMYGHHIHEAVVKAGEKISGLTIHLVDPIYDHGRVLFQKKIDLLPEDDAKIVASRILEQEHFYFPRVIEKYCTNLPIEFPEHA